MRYNCIIPHRRSAPLLRFTQPLPTFCGPRGGVFLPWRLARGVQTQDSQKFVDIMHYHIGDAGPLASTWDEAKDMYKQVLRDPENINYLTIFREPREHLLSYYTFFIEPKTRVSSDVH